MIAYMQAMVMTSIGGPEVLQLQSGHSGDRLMILLSGLGIRSIGYCYKSTIYSARFTLLRDKPSTLIPYLR